MNATRRRGKLSEVFFIIPPRLVILELMVIVVADLGRDFRQVQFHFAAGAFVAEPIPRASKRRRGRGSTLEMGIRPL